MSRVGIFTKTNIVVGGGFLILAGALGGVAWYGHERINTLSTRITDLESTLASTTLLLRTDIATTHASLADALTKEKQDVAASLGSVADKVGTISGTVDTLQKLSKTDPELLQKYSKIFFLNEHYTPERLIQIPQIYIYSNTRSESIHANVWPYLQALLGAANPATELYVKSAYRSFDEQKALKGAYSVTYGAGTANQFSADQGYSEHQLGTTVDFITTGLGGSLSGFEKTAAYQWMQTHAYEYGFVLSYPEKNSYYIFEPWHWRYVGIKLARYLHNTNKYFYDLDQREIDTYLVNLFE